MNVTMLGLTQMLGNLAHKWTPNSYGQPPVRPSRIVGALWETLFAAIF